MSSNLLRRRDISKYACDWLRMSNLVLGVRAQTELESRGGSGPKGAASAFLEGQDQPRGGERVSHLRLRLAVVVGALLALAGSTSGLAASDGVVISQVYGGGGNTGASFTHDFIELFNRGTTPVVSRRHVRAVRERHRHGQPRRQRRTAHRALRHDLSPASTSSSTSRARPQSVRPCRRPTSIDATPIAMAAGAGKVALATGSDHARLQHRGYLHRGRHARTHRRPRRLRKRDLLRGDGRSADPQRHLVGRQGRQRLHGDRRQRGRLRRALAACSSQLRDDRIRLRRRRPRRPTRAPSVRRHPASVLRRREHAPHRHRHAGREPDEHRHHASSAT